MTLLLRIALNPNNPQRAKEAQRLLIIHQPETTMPLLQRIAFGDGDKARARRALKLLRDQVKRKA